MFETSRCIFGTARIYEMSIISDAIKCGYRAFDTAGMPEYYREELLGEAIRQAIEADAGQGSALSRSDFFIQTKFTTPQAQDFTVAPYLQSDSMRDMILKSFDTSLKKLQVSYIDSYLLHGMLPTMEETLEAWAAIETLVSERCRDIGICNVTADDVSRILAVAKIRPKIIQNRFMRRTFYDQELRALCQVNNMTYQAFSIVTENGQLMRSKLIGWLAEKLGVSEVPVLFAMIISLGSYMCVLIGSKNFKRMSDDLRVIRDLVGSLPLDMTKHFEEEIGS